RCGLDANGFLARVALPSGRAWRVENDRDGRVQSLTTPAGLRLDVERVEDAARLGNQHKLDWNAQGKLSAVTDAGGSRTEFRYRSGDRPYLARAADGSVEMYEYDEKGELRDISDRAGAIVRIRRDEQARPVELAYRDGEVRRFEYDQSGRVRSAATAATSSRYEYDENGRVKTEDQDGSPTGYEYDADGRLWAMAYPSGGRVEFSYDGDGRVRELKDWNGGTTRVSYLPEDRGEVWEYPNGAVASIALNNSGLPLNMNVRGGATELFSFRYDYGGDGRVRAFWDSDFGKREYSYDAEGQLLGVSASLSARNETFAYDRGGNRVLWNQQTSELDPANKARTQGHLRFSYDARGNLTGRLSKNRQRRFAYNAQDQLARADDSYGGWAEFGYDAFGRRVWKRSDKAEVRYVWAGEQLIGERTTDLATGKPEEREYLYWPGTGRPVAVRIDGMVFYFHTGRQGDPRRITGIGGEVVWSADYLGFGQAIVQRQKIVNPLRLAGQYHDEETGFHYHRLRYYCPGSGRYITRAPTGLLAGFNLYAYAGNDPINRAGPEGGWSWTVATQAAVAPVSVGAGLVLLAPSARQAALVWEALKWAIEGESFGVKCALARAVAPAWGGLA
ncbi:MAG: RHS repeat-associated core domain-containing protein, partial [Acidobacteriota bacterium]